MTAAAHSARQARINGGIPGNVIQLPRQRPKESWELIREWADRRGWGSWRCAGAMILAATSEERKRFPADQHALVSQWLRWLKGESIPDAHRSDPNVNGFYRPIIARMMGTTPDKIWPTRTTALKAADDANSDLKRRRDRAASRLVQHRQELEELRRQVQRIRDIEDSIPRLEAEPRYLDRLLAVPFPDEVPGQAR